MCVWVKLLHNYDFVWNLWVSHFEFNSKLCSMISIEWTANDDNNNDVDDTIADMLVSFQSILEPYSHRVHRNCMFVDWFLTEKFKWIISCELVNIICWNSSNCYWRLTSKNARSSIFFVPTCTGDAHVTDWTSAKSVDYTKMFEST